MECGSKHLWHSITHNCHYRQCFPWRNTKQVNFRFYLRGQSSSWSWSVWRSVLNRLYPLSTTMCNRKPRKLPTIHTLCDFVPGFHEEFDPNSVRPDFDPLFLFSFATYLPSRRPRSTSSQSSFSLDPLRYWKLCGSRSVGPLRRWCGPWRLLCSLWGLSSHSVRSVWLWR